MVADTYREKSIKCGEKTRSVSPSKVIIGSCKSKVPRDFVSFMKNGENKTRLIEIISEVIIDNRVKAIKLLQTILYFLIAEDYLHNRTVRNTSTGTFVQPRRG